MNQNQSSISQNDQSSTKQEQQQTCNEDHPIIFPTASSLDEDDDEVMFAKLLPPTPNYHNNNDEDLDELLGIEMNTIQTNQRNKKSNPNSHQSNNSLSQRTCCVRQYGNTIVLNTSCYNSKSNNNRKAKCGLIGPHYPGVVFTIGLLSTGSFYFTRKAFINVGTISGCIGIVLTICAFYNLMKIVCVDPGIVKLEDQIVRRKKKSSNRDEDDEVDNDDEDGGSYMCETVNIGDENGWRYCGACSLYQPPKARHCPDCNVCIDHYDHHCPWMGTCIGKNNMSAFMRFNFTWLIFLIYSCLWVIAFGPLTVVK